MKVKGRMRPVCVDEWVIRWALHGKVIIERRSYANRKGNSKKDENVKWKQQLLASGLVKMSFFGTFKSDFGQMRFLSVSLLFSHDNLINEQVELVSSNNHQETHKALSILSVFLFLRCFDHQSIVFQEDQPKGNSTCSFTPLKIQGPGTWQRVPKGSHDAHQSPLGFKYCCFVSSHFKRTLMRKKDQN